MQIILLDSVETFLESLNAKEIAKVIRTVELLEEFGNDLGMPHSRHMSDGLLELRIRGTREVRIFYYFHKKQAILLHACIKKSQKTLDKELARARDTKSHLQ
ncbi:MAG: type II toxin-antitoxin system RelE/ParE family toxin [Candidatus Pacebacteria bacterium]|nr:type II toxin-antitoxin system RelE/ParE family toxin [Candidatus Paceibacterota bacterium]